ncbi:MAG: DUF2218 domain-containing protein [Rubellimicrobium sp.]|nr:DUF2218 domain-containing protein [Rubellimicrobium sp.]
MTLTGTYATVHAARYMQQLLKHFAHKIEVQVGDSDGHAALPVGPAAFTATAAELRVEITLNDPEMAPRARAIIDDHLARFAFREGFERMDWAEA